MADNRTAPVYDERGLNALHVHFGQFLSHDLSLSSPLTLQDYSERSGYDSIFLPIAVPKGDPQFDPKSTDEKHLPFRRSKNGFVYVVITLSSSADSALSLELCDRSGACVLLSHHASTHHA
jgi:hypothetical protein